MKTIRSLFLAVITLAGLSVPLNLQAQTSPTPTPAVTVAPNGDSGQDLKGLPPAVQALLVNFDLTRDQFLVKQDLLLIKLKDATTDAEREAIRVKLQANRDAFLLSIQAFREALKDELAALKGKISHKEFLRIIDAAHDALTEGGLGHHKGH
jgi:hypothetical protein